MLRWGGRPKRSWDDHKQEGDTVTAGRLTIRPVVTAGVLLGIGLGGFVDGVLLHQILQWHHMLTSAGLPPTSVEAIQVNTLWDGLFHAFTWVVSFAGLVLLWRAGQRSDTAWSTRTFFGSLLAGWGLFNLVEGLIDHHLLGIHHVNETVPQSQWILWDLGFLALGALLVLAGWTLARSARPTRGIDAMSEDARRAA
jgi:uncharacterized membrane protein